MSWHKQLKLGAVYRPSGNRDYMYACVRLEGWKVTFLLLINNARWPATGSTWEENAADFVEQLRNRSIVRVT